MVNLSVLALAAASVLPLVSARACTTGLNYCGYNLVNVGDYKNEIKADFKRRAGHPASQDAYEIMLEYGLYSCGVGGVGWIGYIKTCHGACVDGGAGKSDYCR